MAQYLLIKTLHVILSGRKSLSQKYRYLDHFRIDTTKLVIAVYGVGCRFQKNCYTKFQKPSPNSPFRQSDNGCVTGTGKDDAERQSFAHRDKGTQAVRQSGDHESSNHLDASVTSLYATPF